MGFSGRIAEIIIQQEKHSEVAVDAILSNDEKVATSTNIAVGIAIEARKIDPYITEIYIRKHLIPRYQSALRAIKEGKTDEELKVAGFGDPIIGNAKKQHIRDVIDEIFNLKLQDNNTIRMQARNKILEILSKVVTAQNSTLNVLIDNGDEKVIAEEIGTTFKLLVTRQTVGQDFDRVFKNSEGIFYYNGNEKQISRDVIEQINLISLKINNLEEEIKTAQVNLESAKQRGTHNSCWGYPSPHLSNVCVQKYKNILQTKTKVKNKYINLRDAFKEQLQILQKEEASQQQEKEDLVQEIDETVEITIHIAGEVHNKAEKIYEQAI